MSPDMNGFLEALLSGQDAQAEPAMRALAACGDDAVSALAQRLPVVPPDGRWWIARTLAAIHTPLSAKLLVRMMDDPDVSVRACAALALGELCAAEGVEALAAHLADESAHVALLCAEALARIGAAAVPALLRVLQEGHLPERIYAAKALVPIGSSQAIPALIQALDDENAVVAYYAQDALERMGVGMVLVEPE